MHFLLILSFYMDTNQQRSTVYNSALNLVEEAPAQIRGIFTVHVLRDLDVHHVK